MPSKNADQLKLTECKQPAGPRQPWQFYVEERILQVSATCSTTAFSRYLSICGMACLRHLTCLSNDSCTRWVPVSRRIVREAVQKCAYKQYKQVCVHIR